MTTFCCSRGRVPSYGAATMWRIETLSGTPDRVYDRGANSLCCQVVQEGSDRVIYEGGARTAGGKSVAAWVDDPSGPVLLWTYDPGAAHTVYEVCRQTDDDSLWVYRASPGGSGNAFIDRLNYSTGALLNSVDLGAWGNHGWLAAGDGARVSLWSQLNFVPNLLGSTSRALQYDDTLSNVASFTFTQNVVPRGSAHDEARNGWVKSYDTSAAHDNELFDTNLSSTGFVDDAAATGSSAARPLKANLTHFFRFTQSGATFRWERWSGSARVWGITVGSSDRDWGNNCIDADGNFYFSHGATHARRYSAAAGAIDWTYTYTGNSFNTLINDRDLILAFAKETTGTNIVALNRATGALVWSKTQTGFVPTATHPHVGRDPSAVQVFGQWTWVCGNRRT